MSGVAREGIIAAALTSLMILLFLGSWRSTLIIAASIPLAVLAAIAGLSAMGETLNVMTLGGLALAVGILVDDATVTIENINWHLEQGKDVRSAIMDGAAQIVGPAFVSLLCICIVFVPMLLLNGIARFLFVPMAEAVIFAMVASFVLSRTFVPMMAQYLLRPHASGGHASGELAAVMEPHGGHHQRSASRNPLVRFQRGFEHRFERVRSVYRIVLGLALTQSQALRDGLSDRGRRVVSACAVARPQFLSQTSIQAKSPFTCVRRSARASKTPPPNSITSKTPCAASIPPDQLGSIIDNIGLPNSGINLTYNNSGTIGPQDGDIHDFAERKSCADRRLCEDAAQVVAARIPRHDLLVPAGRYRQPDFELRFASADRPAGGGPEPGRQSSLRQRTDAAHAADSRHRRYAHPAGLDVSAIHRFGRPFARGSTRHHRTGRDQLRGGEPLRHQPGVADLLAESA